MAMAEILPAQNRGIPTAITMNTNQRFEGYLSWVEGYSTKVVADSAGVCYVIDNGLRRVYVNKRHILPEEPVPLTYSEIQFPVWQDAENNNHRKPGNLNQAFHFNEHGHRVINVTTAKNQVKNVVQGITQITPRYVKLNSLKSNGTKTSYGMSVGSGAVPVDVIRKLLRNQISKSDSPVEYEKIFGYFLQAQQFDEALIELDLIERRFPERKDQVALNRSRVRQDRARQVVREIGDRIRNGQTNVARELSGQRMEKEGVAQQVLLELQDLITGLDEAQEKVENVRGQIIDLVKRYRENPPKAITKEQETMLGQFLAELESDLSPSNVARLDSYLVQAPDATQKDQEKLALAISGWLEGSNNATPNFALAQSMFEIRDLVKRYLNSRDAVTRGEILVALNKFDASDPRTIANILAQMKPPEHETATAGYTGEKPIEFTVTVPGTRARTEDQNFQVLVHLPIEYKPYQQYPLLITLPNVGVSAQEQLDRFNVRYIQNVGRVGPASRNGVIVASVQWTKPGQTTCAYSNREHMTVLKAMRACFRKFQVNTNKVFLHGHGKGGNLVYDIGLAHPEHFAGVIPVGGHIEKYAKVHATKDRDVPVPIYAVFGDRDFTTQVVNDKVWDKLLLSGRHSNLTLVEYIGRMGGNETFPDDIKPMFEWMQFQRRRLPDRTGFEFSVDSLRPWVNYFWFIELKGFPRENTMLPQLWENGKLKALTIKGEVRAEGDFNQIVVDPSKAGSSMTLWLSDDFVNFDKDVRIKGRGREFKGNVRPSVRVMLEDARIRGDRLHPHWARLDNTNGKWQVAE